MGIGGISIWQLLIILVIVLLLFGTKRLKTLGGDLGGAIKGFKKAMTEEEAKERKFDYAVRYKSVPNWFNAKRIHAEEYVFKTLVDKESNLILGAHILGYQAAEMINLFVFAMCGKITVDQFKTMIFAYPTWGNEIKGMV